jgi:quercetin dioxygenase-like cupin family protein
MRSGIRGGESQTLHPVVAPALFIALKQTESGLGSRRSLLLGIPAQQRGPDTEVKAVGVDGSRRKELPMSHARALTALAAVLGSLALGGLVQASPAPSETPPISVEPLSGFADFTDEVAIKFKRKLPGGNTEVVNLSDPGHLLPTRITVQPGAQFPWHTHPGPVVVIVASGELIYQQASDCVERSYVANDAFLDPGNAVHTAWNPSDTEVTELIALFHDAPVGGPVTIPEADQSDRCP